MAFLQHHVLGVFGGVEIGHGDPFAAELAVEPRLGDATHQIVVLVAIGDEVADGADLEAVLGGERQQVGQPRHAAIVVHDLADHPRRVEPRQPRHIDRRLGMPGADQHAAVLRHQRKDVPRRGDMLGALGRVDGDRDGARAVGGGNPGGDALARLDRHGERGVVAGAVVLRHQRQTELLDPLRRQRQADQPAAVARHEVDRRRRRHLRGHDEVALVLAVLVVDQDEHPAVLRLVDDLLDRSHDARRMPPRDVGFELAERVRGRIPISVIEAAQRIGVEASGAGEARAGFAAIGDEGADTVDQGGGHGEGLDIAM